MKTRRQMNSLTVALFGALLLLGACSSDGEGESTAEAGAPTTAQAVAAEGTGEAEADGGAETEDVAENAEENAEADGGDEPATVVVESQSPPSTGSMVEEVGEVLVETGEGLSGSELEQFLARRYEAYWQAFDLARQAPTVNPAVDYPVLATLVAGEQLELTYGELADLSDLGHAIREPESPAVPGLDANSAHRIRIESLETGVAELVSCLVNDQVRYDVTTGEVLNEQVITVQTKTTMAKADGTWKVIRSAAVGLDEGVAGCWLEPESSFPL